MRIWTLTAIAILLLIACLPINPQPYVIILLLCYLVMTFWPVLRPPPKKVKLERPFQSVLVKALGVVGLMLCALYGFDRLEQKLASQLPENLDHQVFIGKGVITETNIRSNSSLALDDFDRRSVRLDMVLQSLTQVSGQNHEILALDQPKVRLSYYPLGFGFRAYDRVSQQKLDPKVLLTQFAAGKAICFEAKLRRPRGLLNFYGFDYEKWLIEQGYYAVGYIKSLTDCADSQGNSASVSDHQPLPWYQASRLAVIEALNQLFDRQGWENSDVMLALITGSKERLSQARKDWLMQVGLAHLIVISGLHIGLVMAFVYLLATYLFTTYLSTTYLFSSSRFSPTVVACLLAIVGAWGYCLLAGFAPSATRAAIMGTALCLARAYGLNWPVLSGLLLAMLVLLLINPLNALGSGFWLSFGAVFMIYWALIFARVPDSVKQIKDESKTQAGKAYHPFKRLLTGFWQLVKVQFALLLLLTPIVLFTVETFHPISFVINLFCVPLFTLLIVPALLVTALLYVVSPTFGVLGFEVINHVLTLIFIGVDAFIQLEQNAGIGNLGEVVVLDAMTLTLALCAFLLLVYFRTALGVIPLFLLLPLLIPADKSPNYGEAYIDILDVGQGLSLVVETQNYRLIYDTGPRFDAFDLGEQIVVPMLRYRGLSYIGRKEGKEQDLVISHADMDHAGGAQSVLSFLNRQNFNESDSIDVYSGEPDRLRRTWLRDDRVAIKPCHGLTWQRDGVTFRFMDKPHIESPTRSNNQSCVLKVTASGQSILITGDIERKVEFLMLSECQKAQNCEDLQADILVVGHHGSKTSSSARFIDTVKPELAIASNGYKNRFRHPHPKVVERFDERGIQLLSTAHTGGILIKLKANAVIDVTQARLERFRPWYFLLGTSH